MENDQEWRAGKNLETGDSFLFQKTIPTFAWRD